jgi:hypothetical protein
MNLSRTSVAALCILISAAGACNQASKGDASASATVSAKPDTTATSASGGSTATPSGSAVAADKPAGEVKVEDVFKDEDPADNKGVIEVDISKVPDEAPALGGIAAAPAKAEWLPVANLLVMNPGWEKKKSGDMGLLYSADLHAGVAFSGYEAKSNGGAKVDEMVKQLGFTDIHWQKKAHPFKLGEDKSVPAMLYFGKGKSSKGDPLKLFFALMKTGKPVNVVALGGARQESSAEAFKITLGIVALARRAK